MIMKYLKLTLITVLCFFICSCSTTQKNYAVQASSTLAHVNLLKMRYADISASVERGLPTFSAVEQEQLVKLDGTFKLVINRMDNIFEMSKPALTLSDATYLYELTKSSYIQARKIVGAHLDEFTAQDKMRLRMFDDDVLAIDKEIEDLLHDPTNKGISDSLLMMGTVAEIALKVLLPLVL